MWSDPEPSPNWIDGNFCLIAGWLIDGKGTPARRQQYIYVHSGTIKSVVSSPLQEMGDESIIDCSHATILPLLMDAHVHLALSGTTQTKARQSQLSFERDDVYTQVAGHLEAAWQNGVVAVREAGDHNGHVHAFLHGKRPESLPPVDSVLTRWGWHAPGRYGSMIARQPDPVEKLLENAEPDFTVMDHVKIIQSGINSIDVFGKQNPPSIFRSRIIPPDSFRPCPTHQSNGSC